MDVNALSVDLKSPYLKDIQLAAVDNLKRVMGMHSEDEQGLVHITDFQELKTTWHPIENIGGASNSY
jgi:hypothetical protein